MSVNSKVILDHFLIFYYPAKDTEQIENWYWCVSKKEQGWEAGSPSFFDFLNFIVFPRTMNGLRIGIGVYLKKKLGMESGSPASFEFSVSVE